jgi:hypothetical protein
MELADVVAGSHITMNKVRTNHVNLHLELHNFCAKKSTGHISMVGKRQYLLLQRRSFSTSRADVMNTSNEKKRGLIRESVAGRARRRFILISPHNAKRLSLSAYFINLGLIRRLI